jgi:hypothetical protein
MQQLNKQVFHCFAKDASAMIIVLQIRANVERQKFRVGANVTLDICV